MPDEWCRAAERGGPESVQADRPNGELRVGTPGNAPRRLTLASPLGFRLRIDEHDLGRKLPFRTITRANPYALALPQFAYPVAPQCFHMDENVGSVRSPRYEAVALAAIEPFDDRFEGDTAWIGDKSLFSCDGKRTGLRRGIVEGDQTACLQSARSMDHLADDACTFVGGLESRLAHASLVKENVAFRAARRLDEAVALVQVKPLHHADHFKGDFLCV